MEFDAEVHYPNDVRHHFHKVNYLKKISTELNAGIFYDKDRIKIIPESLFRQKKKFTFLSHTELNLLKTRDGKFELSRDENKTRRIFHTGVFLPSKALKFIKIENEPVVGIDAKTSQFLLLANLFRAFIEAKSLSVNFSGKRQTFLSELRDIFRENVIDYKDVDQFCKDVFESDFYEVIRRYLGLSERNQAKIFCFTIIFSKPDNNNPFKEKLRERYPSVINTLDAYKLKQIARLKKKGQENINEGDGFQRLSINLQALESEIFIEKIFDKLHKEKIWCFTRHDSVIVGESNEQRTLEIVNEIYSCLGFVSKFEIEHYNLDDQIFEEEDYEDDIFDDLLFIHNINKPNDINELEIDELLQLLNELKRINSNNYNYIESRVIELIYNELPLDQESILHLFITSQQLKSKLLLIT